MKRYALYGVKPTPQVLGRPTFVDATLFLAKFAFSPSVSTASVMDRFMTLNSALFRLTRNTPTFVLDSRSSSEKIRYTSAARVAAKLKRLEDRPKSAAFFEGDWRTYFPERFKERGLDMIVAPAGYEAEEVCAKLAKEANGIVVSEDSDSLVFGAPTILRGVWKSEEPHLLNLDEILSALEITMPQLIDVGILAGCDFASKIPGVGMNTAVNAIKTHGCIEAYLQHRSKEKDFEFLKFSVEAFDFIRGRENFNRNLDTTLLVDSKLQRQVFLLRLVANDHGLTTDRYLSVLADRRGKPFSLVQSVDSERREFFRNHFCYLVNRFLQNDERLQQALNSLYKVWKFEKP